MGNKPTTPPEPNPNPKRAPDEIVPPLEPPKPEKTIGDPPEQNPPEKADGPEPGESAGDDPETAMPARGQVGGESDEVF